MQPEVYDGVEDGFRAALPGTSKMKWRTARPMKDIVSIAVLIHLTVMIIVAIPCSAIAEELGGAVTSAAQTAGTTGENTSAQCDGQVDAALSGSTPPGEYAAAFLGLGTA